jgi:hypothetical protein
MATAMSGRGSGAVVFACRSVQVLNPMSHEEAKAAALESPVGYFSAKDAWVHPDDDRSEAALLGDLAKRLFQFGNQSVYALRGLNVGRLPRQRTVLDDLDFELNTLVFFNQNRLLLA